MLVQYRGYAPNSQNSSIIGCLRSMFVALSSNLTKAGVFFPLVGLFITLLNFRTRFGCEVELFLRGCYISFTLFSSHPWNSRTEGDLCSSNNNKYS